MVPSRARSCRRFLSLPPVARRLTPAHSTRCCLSAWRFLSSQVCRRRQTACIAPHAQLNHSRTAVALASCTSLILWIVILGSVAGGFAVDLVRDRKLKNKHQLFTSGTSLAVYTAAYFLMDIMLMMIPVTVGVLLMLIEDVAPLIGVAFPATLISLVLYMPMTILCAFVGSYLFKEPDTCQSQLPPIINLSAFMP